MRLWPAYIIALAVALVLNLTGVIPKTYQEGTLAWHLILHAVMLHGIIPRQILAHSSGSILNPMWSISLEWQFYLVAPLILFLLRNREVFGWVVVLFTAIILYRIRILWGAWDGAFLPMQLPLFLVGIGSFYLHEFIKREAVFLKGMAPYFLLTFLGLFLAFVPIQWHFGFFIWGIVFSVVLAKICGKTNCVERIIGRFLESAPMQFVGIISYSVYLIHEIWIWVALFIFGKHEALVILCSVLGTGLSAWLIYCFVEKPAIDFGKRIGRASLAS